MQCLKPWTVGFKADGKSLAWSKKQSSNEFASFQVPCGSCIACRLENAKQSAIRCVHEASLYEKNCFITLTYNNESLKSPKLQYKDMQLFIKKLRNNIFQELLDKMFPGSAQKEQRSLWRKLSKERRDEIYGEVKIGLFTTGEYGDKNKRKHWHAIIFNWEPMDKTYKYSNERGDRVFSSKILDNLWGQGITELGSVTLESAGYCARYAAKKLVHGKDDEHDFHPIHRRSTTNAIGKGWIKKHWKDVFKNGYLVIKTKKGYSQVSIPRYYEKWLKKEMPAEWTRYVTEVKPKIIKEAMEKEEKISLKEKEANFKRAARHGYKMTPVISKKDAEKIILEQKFNQLQKFLKDV